MMGHSSVENPRSVSTASRGELDIDLDEGYVNGEADGCRLPFGGVPYDKAAITS